MDRVDGISAHLAKLGWDCTDIDIVNEGLPGEPSHDLSSASHWDIVHRDMRKGYFHAIIMGTPCETASRARTGPPGPRPLRSAKHIYGLPKAQLTTAEHDQVRLGTYFALKSAETAQLAHSCGTPWVIESQILTEIQFPCSTCQNGRTCFA